MTARMWLAVLCFGVASAVFAVQGTPYTVEKGDNLWNLAGVKLNDPWKWQQIERDNPFLQLPGRKFVRDGKTIVVLKPGEKLVGLEKFGITAKPTLAVGVSDQTTLTLLSDPPESWLSKNAQPLFLLGLLLLLLVAFLIHRMLHRDPATARPPVVQGGVTAATAGEQFQQVASERYAAATGVSHPIQRFTVVEQTAGSGYGIIGVVSADGKIVPRKLNGEPVFRGRVRFPDEHEETLFMLQRCGNDLRFGGISRYIPGKEFRFEPDPSEVSEVAEAAAPATPQAAAPVAEAEAPIASGVKKGAFSLEFTRGTATHPSNMIQIKGGDPSKCKFEHTDDGAFSVTYRFTDEPTPVPA